MTLNIICDKDTRDKVCAVYGKKHKGHLCMVEGVNETLYLDFLSEGEGITGDLPAICDGIAREYWKRYAKDKYIKNTLLLKDDYPCYGFYVGDKKCNECILWRECANDG